MFRNLLRYSVTNTFNTPAVRHYIPGAPVIMSEQKSSAEIPVETNTKDLVSVVAPGNKLFSQPKPSVVKSSDDKDVSKPSLRK